MILLADGATRLTTGMQQAGINYRFQFAEHPIHKAAKDPDLERAFDEVARRAFGLRVTIDRYAGASVPLLVGERPAFEHLEGVPTQEYLDALARIPQLDAQGDGVKPQSTDDDGLLSGSERENALTYWENWTYLRTQIRPAGRASRRCNFLTLTRSARRCSTIRILCRPPGWSRYWLWPGRRALAGWPISI